MNSKNQALLILFCMLFIACKQQEKTIDIIIKNGIVYDGLSTTGQKINIGIHDDKIVFVSNKQGQIPKAAKVIDAEGLIVCPGFIDPHTHADRDLNKPDKSPNHPFLMQGVTTVVVGNDGSSFFPISEYKSRYEKQGIGTNAILLTGHGTVRKKILGASNRAATQEDVEKMKAVVKMEMEAGAFGMSTGLYYAPGSYSNTEEVIELAKVVAEYDGIYDTHLRDESSFSIGLVAAVEEAIEIGREAKLPIHISHIKCLGVDVWNQSNEVINKIEKAQKEGINVTANQYPYNASATSLNGAVIPRWAESGGLDSLFIRYDQQNLKQKILADTKKNIARRGGPDRLLIVNTQDSTLFGKNLLEIADRYQLLPEEAAIKILKTGYIGVVSFNMQDEDIKNFMQQDWVVTGSDGNSGHPRKYGSFPRMYDKYVKSEKVIGLGAFIKKCTAKTAEIFKIPNRGKIIKGDFADIIIFDPENFKDIADFKDPFQLAQGLEYSIINGQISVENGKATNKKNGKVLTK